MISPDHRFEADHQVGDCGHLVVVMARSASVERAADDVKSDHF